ncbi:MAG TPA: class I SAM-dependent methyltransferase [Pseudobdellovibrionaceae bacterium]|jgi:16S rRNA (guanine1516-N2)-methyltransferase
MGTLGCIVFKEGALEEKALEKKVQRLADFLQIPVNPPDLQAFPFFLEITLEGLRLIDSQRRVLEIDFQKDHLNYQRKGVRGKNELLAKALGYAKGTRKVLDLSAGLGIDAVFMTQLGFQVTSVERSKLLFVLLDEALRKAPELQDKLHFVSGDSSEYLRSPASVRDVDAIFFDPMYPHKKKTALPKQEMVVFRELVGNDEDAVKVLEEALRWPVNRVVVKRPLGAEPLLPGVRHVYEGKVVRYDVYMR